MVCRVQCAVAASGVRVRFAMSEFPGAPYREQHLELLLEFTQIPTAAGREHRVIDWIRAWVACRPDLCLSEDRAGNLVIQPRRVWTGGAKSSRGKAKPSAVYITAHLDHPAFVIERIIGPQTVEMSFRGGVMDEYFADARVVVHTAAESIGATLTGEGSGVGARDGSRLFKTYLADLDDRENEEAMPHGPDVRIGDVATWALPPAAVDDQGLVHTPVCDDLAAAAAALCAMDVLRGLASQGEKLQDVRLLFTRSEEIGFTGAIAACKLKTIERGARVVALENSRSYPDSPMGGGPIVRVGDRMSVFDPTLTAACAKRAEDISGHAATPHAKQKSSEVAGWKWQRKLMAGGACEATVFCAYGYRATCLCLPLGNYHNMASLAEVQDGTYDASRLGPPRVGREIIHKDDYFGMIDLLVAIGQSLPEANPAVERIERLFARTAHVVGMSGEMVSGKGGKGARVARRSPSASRERLSAKPAAPKKAQSSRSAKKKPRRGGGA